MRLLYALYTLLALACLTQPLVVRAEKADRDKPVNLEADRVTVDDKKKTQVFEGNVQLTEGTLLIRTDRLVVTQDDQGFQKAVATGGLGGLAHFRQKREAKDEYVDGEAERIEHDDRADKTEFFGRGYIKSGLDELRGNYILYDAKTENYLVTPGTAPAAPGRDARVRAVIQPKNKDQKDASGPAKPAAAEAPLKTSPDVAIPRQE